MSIRLMLFHIRRFAYYDCLLTTVRIMTAGLERGEDALGVVGRLGQVMLAMIRQTVIRQIDY